MNAKHPRRSCAKCGIEVKGQLAYYCSQTCQQSHLAEKRYTLWLAGQAKANASNPSLRRMLTRRDTYKCNTCGISSWCHKTITLEVEHKDGDALNNLPSNLCLLCPNGHSQTATYKARNKGRGRISRLLYHKQQLKRLADVA